MEELFIALIFVYFGHLSIKMTRNFTSASFKPEQSEDSRLIERTRSLEPEAIQSDDAKVQAIKTLALHHLVRSEINEELMKENIDWRQRSILNNSWKEERTYILSKAREANLIPAKPSAEESLQAMEELLKEDESGEFLSKTE